MKLAIQTIELTEETILSFARFVGYQTQILTEGESPNRLIDNPQTPQLFLLARYADPIRNDLAAFKVAALAADLEQKRQAARQADERALQAELEKALAEADDLINLSHE